MPAIRAATAPAKPLELTQDGASSSRAAMPIYSRRPAISTFGWRRTPTSRVPSSRLTRRCPGTEKVGDGQAISSGAGSLRATYGSSADSDAVSLKQNRETQVVGRVFCSRELTIGRVRRVAGAERGRFGDRSDRSAVSEAPAKANITPVLPASYSSINRLWVDLGVLTSSAEPCPRVRRVMGSADLSEP